MTPLQERVAEIIQLIKSSRVNAIRAVNTELINLNYRSQRYHYVLRDHPFMGAPNGYGIPG
jgi:hypothetical protein